MSLQTVNLRIYFHLPPCFIGDFMRGINEQLNSYLMRYIPELKGVPLSYSNVRIQEKAAKVLYDSPHCHLHATVTFTLFAPKEGTQIVGIVNKVSSDHIGLLVHGVFNASIAADHIRKQEYHYNHGAKAWRRVDDDGEPTGEKILAGSVVKFTIIGLPTNNNMLTLSGSLTKQPESTGLIILDPETTPPHPSPVLIHEPIPTPSTKKYGGKKEAEASENKKIYFDMEAEINDAHQQDADEWVVKAGEDLEGLVEGKEDVEPPVKKAKKEKKVKSEKVKVEEPIVQAKAEVKAETPSESSKPKKRKSEGDGSIKKVKKEKKAKV
ncbi:UNVERIFIED_CONTAM: hypothetical protein HDU68_002964 [Siphonaria sp. JEL0065]|nr:hypothetical protein HDU68_002964 [Siphonaria sp. JEL0065]